MSVAPVIHGPVHCLRQNPFSDRPVYYYLKTLVRLWHLPFTLDSLSSNYYIFASPLAINNNFLNFESVDQGRVAGGDRGFGREPAVAH